MERHTLVDDGVELVVEAWYDGRNRARLLVDGAEAAVGDTDAIGQVDLGKGTHRHVRVLFRWRGRVSRVGLVEKIGSRTMLTRFAPPPGSASARAYAFEQKHPNLFAARHVAVNVGGTLLAILGVGALLRALLPAFDFGVDLDAPGWLRYLDPVRYLKPLFEWVPNLDLPHAPWAKFVVGFLIAVAIAVLEARRRKQRSG